MPQVKLGPETLQEEDLRVLVTLPKHKVTQPTNTARPDEQVQGWVFGRVHTLVERRGRDILYVREDRHIAVRNYGGGGFQGRRVEDRGGGGDRVLVGFVGSGGR